VGARPQFIKVAPLTAAIKAHNEAGRTPAIEHSIVHTGQHYDHDMAQLFFVELGIPEPRHNLGVSSVSHGEQLARMIERLEPVLKQEQPDWVITYGDTNSTLAGAITAARLLLPLAHVEAGCRSYNRDMPEEQNRVVADHLSRLLLAPSHNAMEALRREGIGTPDDPLHRKASFVGDIMYDALLRGLRVADNRTQANLKRFGLKSKNYYLLTLHRSENTDRPERLEALLETLESVDLPILFPVHPRTRKVLAKAGVSMDRGRIQPISPLGYLDMLGSEKHARKILTDSGGVQKEALYLKVPCITLREETEWPETIESGANCLTGLSRDKVLDAIKAPSPDFDEMKSPFGVGNSCQLILNELLSFSKRDVENRPDFTRKSCSKHPELKDAQFLDGPANLLPNP